MRCRREHNVAEMHPSLYMLRVHCVISMVGLRYHTCGCNEYREGDINQLIHKHVLSLSYYQCCHITICIPPITPKVIFLGERLFTTRFYMLKFFKLLGTAHLYWRSELSFFDLAWLDIANYTSTDFHKLGGFNLVSSLLNEEAGSLRWRAANLLATCVQNHPYCQRAALELKLMPRLLQLLDSDDSDMVRVKVLYAVSCE